MRNKIISILLVVTLGMGCIACGDTKSDTNSTTSNNQTTSKETDNETTVVAESSIDESLFQYDELDNGNIAVWGYDGEVEELVIPETIDGKTVEVIGARENGNGFAGAKIKSVVIPDTVKKINNQSFIGSNVESVALGDGVEEIGEHTFGGTQIKEITIPTSVNSIGKGAFVRISTLSKVVFEGDIENMNESFIGLAEDVVFYGPANSNVQAYVESIGSTYVVQ